MQYATLPTVESVTVEMPTNARSVVTATISLHQKRTAIVRCPFFTDSLLPVTFLSYLTVLLQFLAFFSARQHICYSAQYAIARPSVCPSFRPSVPLSVTRVDQSKTVEVRITQPSPQSSPMI